MAPVSILDRDFDAKIAGLPHDEARASLMEHAIRAQIAVYGLLAEEPGAKRKVAEGAAPYVVRFDEGLKTVARQVDDVIAQHRSIVDWHLNNDVQREMRRDIQRLLRGARTADEAEPRTQPRPLSRRRARLTTRRWRDGQGLSELYQLPPPPPPPPPPDEPPEKRCRRVGSRSRSDVRRSQAGRNRDRAQRPAAVVPEDCCPPTIVDKRLGGLRL